MRTLQLLGFILAIAGVIWGYITLASIDGQTSEASAGAAGLSMILIVLPIFGCSALMLVPSSLVLCKSEVRLRTYFKGSFWLSLWELNLVISAVYIFVALYVGYLWL
ncbi:carbon starvation protein CstA [Shewanella baltica]|uniref:carbon starvation protein CstA n=1 Tax=Shewanella baltica TaxID=62322 RepID=UPI00217DFFFB|nr:carbon starvation protein CstA [Shewanella baltica]MCS6129559.1 carbon starvation protein CstA [Shewanella baltica]MCS6141529.1 carbon starvation protein CstA [Shewanella baltica]MCS6147829.1 carbon starvation protein CstA [Shewanella baltica]MCS6172358.1 carbon starvation protein CstA [Shewanella baltica]MCS6189616.1 carbon starvation protein CstA [Shewanella baltica]